MVTLPDPVNSFHANNANANANNANSNTNVNSNYASALLSSSLNNNAESNSDGTATTTSTLPSMENLSVGFIGCGTIASSIARGLSKAATCHVDDVHSKNTIGIQNMVVSKRSESKSRALCDDLSSKLNISVTETNQEILDACDLIFLTVIPQKAAEVLQGLEFDPNRHILVSLVSTANLQDLVRDSKLDLSRVAKMICLPSIARHKGVALLCCGDNDSDSDSATSARAFLTSLFGNMGGVVCLDTEADLEACMVTTCTMGPLYGTMKNQRDWLMRHTNSLSKADASFLVVEQFAGAISDASRELQEQSNNSNSNGSENRLEDLIEEQTPGGLNEQALKNYGTVLGGFAELQDPVMDAILSRIRGETDGSLNNSNDNDNSNS